MMRRLLMLALLPLLLAMAGAAWAVEPFRASYDVYRGGRAIGVATAMGLAKGTTAIFEIPTSLPVLWTIVALIVSASIGLFFGIYPAWRAARLDPIVAQLEGMAEVEYIVMTAGSFDIMLEVVCESDNHLLELVSKKIRSVPGVRGTESFVYLKLHKQTYSWGVR